MFKNGLKAVCIAAGTLTWSAWSVSTLAQTTTREQAEVQTQARERIYGSQMMSDQERNEYHRRMQEAKTEQERERIREEHHERMVKRAQERGIKLPDEPPARPRDMPKHMGPQDGSGMGPGGGGGRR